MIFLSITAQNGELNPGVQIEAGGLPIDTGERTQTKTGFAYTDITGDDLPDIILSKNLNVRYYPNTGTTSAPSFGESVTLGDIDQTRFDVGDWNADGLQDIVTGSFNGEMRYFANTGTVSSPQMSTVSEKIFEVGQRSYTRYPRLMDFNNDGMLDVMYSINWGYFGICIQREESYFEESRLTTVDGSQINVRSEYNEHQAPDFADFNGDGIADLITSGKTGDVIIFYGVSLVQYETDITKDLINGPHDQQGGLGHAMDVNDTLYNRLYSASKNIVTYLNGPLVSSTARQEGYDIYSSLVTMFPEYLQRPVSTEPCIAQYAGYVWVCLLEARDDTAANRADVAALTKQWGYYESLVKERGIILTNNDAEPQSRIKYIHDLIMAIDPDFYAVSWITQAATLTGRGIKYYPLKNSKVNIFAGEEFTNAENSFPSSCSVCNEAGRNTKSMVYELIVAHELGHNELDQKLARAYRFELKVRKYSILKKAAGDYVVWKTPVENGYDKAATKSHWTNEGYWDGVSDWDATLKSFYSEGIGAERNLRSLRGRLGYFIIAPQEAFASLTNQWFTDTKLMLDFALERTLQGYTENMDWWLLAAEFYSKGVSFYTVQYNLII